MKASLLTAGLLALSSAFATPSPTKVQRSHARRANTKAPPGFIYAEDGKFKIDGKDFYFAGTTAYWLTQVNSNEDITKTLDGIAADDLQVVRIWGFREVIAPTEDDPETYTQLWENGVAKCNQPGIDRIKFILQEAEKRGIYVQVALTNNWSPDFKANGTDTKFRPGSLSNSFGGIDTFVQQTVPGGDHDLFYTDEAVKSKYRDWLNCIVPQIASYKSLFAWEMANDPRCKGADGRTTSGACNAQVVTKWTADTSAFVKSLDANHMAASGDGGFYCTDCKKLFPRTSPPTVSGGSRSQVGKRNKRRNGYLTRAMVLEQIKAREKAAYKAARNAPGVKKRTIRGSWAAPATSFKRLISRQSDSSVGPGYDGSYFVDTEDIANIPTIDYQSFQFFADQNTYHQNGMESSGPPEGGAGGENFEHTLQSGIDWITNHADTAQAFGKPTHLTSIGLVNGDSSGSYVPFYSTNVQAVTTTTSTLAKRDQAVSNDEQQDKAYGDWTDHAINSGINGITNYQRGESGLKSSNSNGKRNSGSDEQGNTPDDGYRITKEGTKNIFKNAGKKQKEKSGSDSS